MTRLDGCFISNPEDRLEAEAFLFSTPFAAAIDAAYVFDIFFRKAVFIRINSDLSATDIEGEGRVVSAGACLSVLILIRVSNKFINETVFFGQANIFDMSGRY